MLPPSMFFSFFDNDALVTKKHVLTWGGAQYIDLFLTNRCTNGNFRTTYSVSVSQKLARR